MNTLTPLNKKINYTVLSGLFLLSMMLMAVGCGSMQETVPEISPPQAEIPPRQPEIKEQPEEDEPVRGPLIDPGNIPETPREMRAAWIATVDNIDWPSEPGLPVAQQKAELRALLDRAVQLNLNAVIFQVRPAADAQYRSSLEPWSEFLTGKQGKAPSPYYDPLAFAINEAHRRGLELHAWFNPFRAYHFAAQSGFAEDHIKNTQPDLVLKYGRYWWLDPGQPQARRHSMNVILDVAKRYDIDGVHLDDYFYPYAEKDASGNEIPFPDNRSYQNYINQNGPLIKGDWRRQNINRFVETLYKELKQVKPHVRFGISPFGIWRPGHPEQIKGYDAYANIYADARTWIREGWVDYLSPQLYWSVDQRAQSFPVLLEWWQQQNNFDRHLWPGLYTSRVGRTWDARQISQQIQVTQRQDGATGHIHFSMKALMNNVDNIADQLMDGVYSKPAVIPATDWISDEKPPQPEAELSNLGGEVLIQLSTDRQNKPWLWVLKTRYGDQWHIAIIPGWKQSRLLPMQNKNGSFAGAVVSVIDQLGNESVPQMLLPVRKGIEETRIP